MAMSYESNQIKIGAMKALREWVAGFNIDNDQTIDQLMERVDELANYIAVVTVDDVMQRPPLSRVDYSQLVTTLYKDADPPFTDIDIQCTAQNAEDFHEELGHLPNSSQELDAYIDGYHQHYAFQEPARRAKRLAQLGLMDSDSGPIPKPEPKPIVKAKLKVKTKAIIRT